MTSVPTMFLIRDVHFVIIIILFFYDIFLHHQGIVQQQQLLFFYDTYLVQTYFLS